MAMNLARTHQLEQLTGAQKAAILCMVLGSESAALITQKLGQEEVEQLSFARMAPPPEMKCRLPPMSPRVVQPPAVWISRGKSARRLSVR